jgi:hypothetical protein
MSANPTMVEEPRPAADVEQKIKALDARLDDLRNRRKRAEVELNRITREENKLIRIFAEADGHERHEIRGRLSGLATDRTSEELEMRGLAVAIAEAEQERTTLLPEFEAQWKVRSALERKKKLQDLWAAHEANQKRVQECEKALDDAKVLTNQSFFAFTTLRDQESINERLAATERLKEEWQRQSGPNAPANRRG